MRESSNSSDGSRKNNRSAYAGQLGRNSVRRNDGRIELLPGCVETRVEAGEAVEIVTPTGGGWGKP
jgi:N-methylhydantoinase B/oxoprolinase/acetone carboxylase alpha subunit